MSPAPEYRPVFSAYRFPVLRALTYTLSLWETGTFDASCPASCNNTTEHNTNRSARLDNGAVVRNTRLALKREAYRPTSRFFGVSGFARHDFPSPFNQTLNQLQRSYISIYLSQHTRPPSLVAPGWP